MALANYSDISSELAVWLNRTGFTDVTDRAADFIAIAQRRIHRECDLNAMEGVASLTIDSQAEDVPADFLRVKSITIQQSTSNYPVTGAPHSQVMSFHATGRPLIYSVLGDSFYFGPSPDQSYTAQLVYYKALPILSVSETTNWFSDNAPELLLWASILEACLFLKDDVRAQVWEGRYTQLRDEILKSEDRMDKEYGGIRVRAI